MVLAYQGLIQDLKPLLRFPIKIASTRLILALSLGLVTLASNSRANANEVYMAIDPSEKADPLRVDAKAVDDFFEMPFDEAIKTFDSLKLNNN